MINFLSRLSGSLRTWHPHRTRRPSRYRQLRIEALDPRLMMSVTPAYVVDGAALTTRPEAAVAPFPTQQEIDQWMGLPVLNSLPGAPATLYLDFNGNFISSFSSDGKTYTNVTTPVWDMDGNPSSFSAAEQAVIKEVWARVAEDFAPFNINVSTAYYGTFDNGQALRVAIGGNNTDWLHGDASGVASIGSFSDDQPNIVFAFDMIAWANAGVQDGEGRPMNGPAALATTISHEAGHAFGLRHHSTYDANGKVVDKYDPGTLDWTPIMGANRANDRTTWAYLPTDEGANVWQDDMAVIAGAANGFGFRADDHGNTIATADALTSSKLPTINNAWSGSGIINQPNDVDVFKFTASSGTTQIEVNAAKYGPNLLPVLQLWSSSGLVANAGYVTPTRSVITANLTAGQTYYVMVKSVGIYGSVGQYTVSVSTVLTFATTSASTMTMGSALAVMSQPKTTSFASATMVADTGLGQGANLPTGTEQGAMWPEASLASLSLPMPIVKTLARPTAGGAPVLRVPSGLPPAATDAAFRTNLAFRPSWLDGSLRHFLKSAATDAA